MAEGQLGTECYVFRNSATWGSPTFVELGIVNGDVAENLSQALGEIISRENDFVLTRPGKKRWTASVPINNKSGDAGLEALRDAYNNKTPIDLWFADGPAATVGTQGPRAEWYVAEFPRTEPMEGAVTINVSLALADNGNTPTWRETSA